MIFACTPYEIQLERYDKNMGRLIEIDHNDNMLSTFILFVQTAQVVLKYADSYLYRKAHLSVSKLIVLQALARRNGGMRPSKIAEWTNTERHNITALVNRMGQDGLVTSERNSTDRRIVNIILTEKGREVLNQAMPMAEKVVKQTMSSISESDTLLLKEKLTTLRLNAHCGLEDLAARLT